MSRFLPLVAVLGVGLSVGGLAAPATGRFFASVVIPIINGLQNRWQGIEQSFNKASMGEGGHRFIQAYQSELQYEAQVLATEGPALSIAEQESWQFLQMLQEEQAAQTALNQINNQIAQGASQLSLAELNQLINQRNQLTGILQNIQRQIGIIEGPPGL